MYTLVADFGGTNTRLALAHNGQVAPSSLRRYRNADFPGPMQAIRSYLSEQANPAISSACVAAAGPVTQQGVVLTNYPWTLKHTQLAAETGTDRLIFLNDLQAQGYALHALKRSDLVPVLDGLDMPGAPRVIVAVGTGVNAAVAHDLNGRLFVPPSEAGHAAFGAADALDLQIAQAVRAHLGHCPIEGVISGVGLARLWAFFGGDQNARGEDVTQAFAAGDPAAIQAVRRFSGYLASHCADLALGHLARGGIFLGGSVGNALAGDLNALGFAEAFRRPGPYQPILREIPVWAVPSGQLTLDGCAIAAAQGS
ncbi:ROK family protein [Thalassovita sp.]|jgi:glucokinase|uniref:glucokinase n=1 Tax=Thalassovita sp. TaxID=1979401 RepID=UPI003B5CAFBE